MANLYGSTVDADKRDYKHLVTEGAYLPDEVKLYPCALVAGTGLCEHYKRGTWRPYTEEELLDVVEKTVKPLLGEGMKAMGKAIQAIMAEYRGRVDGKAVSDAVKVRFQKG